MGLDSLKIRVLLVVMALCLPALAEEPAEAPNAIVQNYCDATRGQAQAFQGASMEVEIAGALPELKKSGKLHALRHISKVGRITYQVLGFEGDGAVKNQVIARYLSAEVEAQKDEAPSLAVTPENYKFDYKGKVRLDGRDTYLFQVTPRKKRAGLFKGKVWIDEATYLRVQEAGYLVKSPSVFLKRVAFVREYEIRDGMSVPTRTESTVDTRIVGKAELTIDYTNFSVGDETEENNLQ
jgi:hypothetical protein